MSARPRRPAAAPPLRASGDRWLFGYADVVTLLFASFAALSTTQIGRATERAAGSAGAAAERIATAVIREAPASPTLSLERELAAIAASARGLGIDLTARAGGFTISVAEAGSFPPGRADLTPDAARVIRQLAATLQPQPFAIRVEGHTDDRPISTSSFASNWELSTARATAVVRFLIEACRLAPERLSAAGFAEHRPRGPNGTVEDRARNRRVDIVVIVGAGAAATEDGARR
jgi:chemotaxis protein MotB